jgi:hypothetical protein
VVDSIGRGTARVGCLALLGQQGTPSRTVLSPGLADRSGVLDGELRRLYRGNRYMYLHHLLGHATERPSQLP